MKKITREHLDCTDRYRFDWNECHFSKGYAQIDTKQDVSYFGQWANPETLRIVKFQEGDLEVRECESEAEFVQELEELREWSEGLGYWLGIDPMLRPEIEAGFRRLGLGNLLH